MFQLYLVVISKKYAEEIEARKKNTVDALRRDKLLLENTAASEVAHAAITSLGTTNSVPQNETEAEAASAAATTKFSSVGGVSAANEGETGSLRVLRPLPPPLPRSEAEANEEFSLNAEEQRNSALSRSKVVPLPEDRGGGNGDNQGNGSESRKIKNGRGSRLSREGPFAVGGSNLELSPGRRIWETMWWLVRSARGAVQRVATSGGLELFVMVTITANTIFMAADSDCDFCTSATCAQQKGILEGANVVFTAIFTFESVVKLVIAYV